MVGESGCGKSMLALSIMGLLPRAVRLTAGRIRLDGEDLVAAGPRRAPAARARSCDDLPGADDRAEPGHARRRRSPKFCAERRGMPATDARRETLALFRRVEIPRPDAMLDAYPHEMSGGMRQRVMIAMALAARAELLIADEPTTALDVTIQAQILALLRNLQRESELSILFITHDLGVIAEIADRVLVLYAGRVVELSSARATFDNPRHPYTRALLVRDPEGDRAARAARIGRRRGARGRRNAAGLPVRAALPADARRMRCGAAAPAHDPRATITPRVSSRSATACRSRPHERPGRGGGSRQAFRCRADGCATKRRRAPWTGSISRSRAARRSVWSASRAAASRPPAACCCG